MDGMDGIDAGVDSFVLGDVLTLLGEFWQ